MAYQLNDNSGNLFLNDKKQTANHPDFTGRAIIGGKLYYLSMWLKTSKNKSTGEPVQYYSLAFKPADAQQSTAPRASFPAFPQFGQPQAPVQQAQIFPGHQAPAQAPAPVQTMPSFQNEPAESPYPAEAPQDDLPF